MYDIIPTPAVQRFFRAAIKDKKFVNDMREIDPEWNDLKLHRFMGPKWVLVIACMYQGYLSAKGDKQTFEKLEKK